MGRNDLFPCQYYIAFCNMQQYVEPGRAVWKRTNIQSNSLIEHIPIILSEIN